jgi:3-deoxy-D-arabino-heptulosonate 7-phosphate (DAHP) synthase
VPTVSSSRCTPDPDHAASDGAQTLRPDQFNEMLNQIEPV